MQAKRSQSFAVLPNPSLKRSANGRPRCSNWSFLLPRGLPLAPA
jgi:hypothetical protein